MGVQTIKLTDVIGNGFCIATEDGEKVHGSIVAAINSGDRVQLSFAGIEDLTSAFLNAAVGQLYGEYNEEELREVLLPPVDASQDDLTLLKRVVETAKDFFRDPDRFRDAVSEVIGDDNL